MSVWSRFAKMDSALQRGLDNSFAFVFGGKLVATEIEEALKQCAEDEAVSTYEGYVEVPSGYIVAVSAQDCAHLQENSPRLPWDYADRLTRYFRNQGWRTTDSITVTITADESLRTGQLKTACTNHSARGATGYLLSTDDEVENPAPANEHDDDSNENAVPEPSHESAQQASAEHVPPTGSTVHPDGAAAGSAAASSVGAYASPGGYNPNTGATTPRGNAAAWNTWEQPQRREPSITLLLRDGSSRTYHVEHGSTIIGRSHEADFRLPDTGVSRQHAELTWDGEDAVIVDLQSTNGTLVNDMPIDNWLLADGDVICVGHSSIEVRITYP